MPRRILYKNAIISHKNVDFARDLMKYLAKISWRCIFVMEDQLLNIIDGNHVFIIMDVDADQRHYKIARRFTNSNRYSCELFVVNAASYAKNDWQKIKTYADMLEVRAKLALRADPLLQMADAAGVAWDPAACECCPPAA